MHETKKWEELTLANNFMFYKIMSSDAELCRELLERLLKFKIEKVVIQNEHVIEGDAGGKSIRLDVYAAETSKVYDLEMQTTNPCDIMERSRYYQALMDVDCLDSGERYGNLPENYVIFICLTDPFDKKLSCYTFSNRCHEAPEMELNDRTLKVFYNASSYKAEKDDKVREFLKFLATNQSDGSFSQDLKNRVALARKNAQWRHSYMTLERYGKEQHYEGYQQGIAEGERIKALETAKNFLSMGLSAEQVAKGSGIDLQTVLKIQNELKLVSVK